MDRRSRSRLSAALFAVTVLAASVGPAAAQEATTVASPSPAATTPDVVRMTVAGTEYDATPIELSAELPPGWSLERPFLVTNDSLGTRFFVSTVDNTFSDPCTHVPRSPKIEPTVEETLHALLEIPGSTATVPVMAALGGESATYLELSLVDAAPCPPERFYWWQDSPGNHYWGLAADEILSVWLIDVRGTPVAVTARTYADTSAEARTALEAVLDSIAFESASP